MSLDPDVDYSRYSRTWLVFRCADCLPSEALWIAWRWSAALRLATMSRNTSGRSAFISFLGDSAFRSALLRHTRQHWKEWMTFENMVMMKSFKRSSLFQKGIHLFVNTLRMMWNIRGLQKIKDRYDMATKPLHVVENISVNIASRGIIGGEMPKTKTIIEIPANMSAYIL